MADPSNGERSDVWTADLRSRFDELVDEYRASLHDSLDGLTEEEGRGVAGGRFQYRVSECR